MMHENKDSKKIKEENVSGGNKAAAGKRKISIGWIILLIIGILVIAWFVYTGSYYHSEDVSRFLTSDEVVTVREEKDYWFFDGPGTDKALVFYPGAKVEAKAYAPLMRQLAEEGYDTFLAEMPFRMALFGINRMDEFRDKYQYKEWYLAGHSMGGAMGAMYTEKHPDELSGLIFLAAYSSKDLTGASCPVLSIYGSEDGVLNMEKVEKGRSFMPEDYEESCIEGGNHAGFAYYGPQKGDGKALIDRDTQIRETVERICAFFE